MLLRPSLNIFLLCISLLIISSCMVQPLQANRALKTHEIDPLPVAVTNNSVTAVSTPIGDYWISFNGLLKNRQWNDTTAMSFMLPPDSNEWQRVSDVPGKLGRLASIAAAVGPFAYVFGGYTVEADHSEVSLPFVHRFDPMTKIFSRMADMPVPVDDAMAVVYQNRFIYLISGWHDTANVNLVQRYDTQDDTWLQATAYPGDAVFGHSGGIVGNDIIVCGGVKIKTHAELAREFVMNTDCFGGTIRAENPRRIDWRSIPAMPDPARYRMAATGSEKVNGVTFVGGSENPYNYDGIGYDGRPSAPASTVWRFKPDTNSWLNLGHLPVPTMDHRGLIETQDGFVTIGGMGSSQKVLDMVRTIQKR